MPFPLNQLAPQYGPQSQPLPGGGTLLQTPRFTKEQSSIFNNLAQLGAQNTDFGAIEDRARKQFHSQTVPSLAERFTAMGGSQRSSAFQGALGQAGADLESQLSEQRAGHGFKQLKLGLQPQFESHLQPSEFQGGLSGLFSGLGAAAPALTETGLKYLLGGNNSSSQLLGGQGGQAPTQNSGSGIGQALAGLAPTAAGALTSGAGFGSGISSALSGLGGSLAGFGAAAAPFVLPAAAAAGVVGLPLLLSYLLED